MGSCVSCCGCLTNTAAEAYTGIATALPFLHLPTGKTAKSEGMLIVQILRDTKIYSKAPVITLLDETKQDSVAAAMHNVSGERADLPSNIRGDGAKELSATRVKTSDAHGHSMYVMVLMRDIDIAQVTLVIDFGTPEGGEGSASTAGPNANVFKIKLSDPTVVVSSDATVAFNAGETKESQATFHDQTVNTHKFSLSVVRYNVLPNQRYPYNKPELQGLIEATAESDFNPYPKPINHIQKGKVWVNWATTLASRPNRIYSDGAIFEGEEKARYPSPRTVEDCAAIVQYARENKLTVRVFGSNHSFAPLSSTDGVLCDNRQLNCVAPSPGFDPLNNGKEWPGYAMTLNKSNPAANGNPTVQFPPGICTGDLERWLEVNGGYRMPTSTVEDVFTMGGILATGCHGTGKLNPTCSDWVVEMEFIDWEGKLQRISKDYCPPEYLKKVQLAAGDANSAVQLDHADVYRAMLCNLGAFGIIWSYTMRVYNPSPIYLVAKTVPWKELFDDTEQARENLAKLQAENETFECFYFPFRFSGKLHPVYEENPLLYIWLGNTTPPKNYSVYEPSDAECFGQDLTQHMGIYMLGKWFQRATAQPALYAMMPYLASMMFLNLLLTVDKQNKECAWRIPQWRFAHPFNAIGSVEGVPCCDIEWSLPMNVKQGGAGFLHPNRSYGDLIRAIHDAHRSSDNPFDMARFPVTITAEMRIMHGSGALMSPQYYEKFDVDDVSNGEAYCAPEIVTHAGNKGWDDFYAKMNAVITDPKNAQRYGLSVKTHQAKEGAVLKNHLAYLRQQYRREPYKGKNPFDYFTTIRDVIDPTRLFCNPYLVQFLYTDNAEYKPPADLPLFTRGQIQVLDPDTVNNLLKK